ncbi:hypothetical protein D9M71_431130 [compost metagenome]
MADADNFLRGDAHADQRFQNRANASRVEARFVQQPGLIDQEHDGRDLRHVIAYLLDQHQVAIGSEVLQAWRNFLSALQHRRVSPGPAPTQPTPRAALAPDHCQSQQVVEATAVDADGDHFAALKDAFQGDAWPRHGFPVLSAGPVVRTQCQANLDVKVLCQELLEAAVGGVLTAPQLIL